MHKESAWLAEVVKQSSASRSRSSAKQPETADHRATQNLALAVQLSPQLSWGCQAGLLLPALLAVISCNMPPIQPAPGSGTGEGGGGGLFCCLAVAVSG